MVLSVEFLKMNFYSIFLFRFKHLLNDYKYGEGRYTFLQQLLRVSNPATVVAVTNYMGNNLNKLYFQKHINTSLDKVRVFHLKALPGFEPVISCLLDRRFNR